MRSLPVELTPPKHCSIVPIIYLNYLMFDFLLGFRTYNILKLLTWKYLLVFNKIQYTMRYILS